MTQITVPWTEKDPERLGGYRTKAIGLLLGLGLLLLVTGVLVFWVFSMGADNRVHDWRVAVAYLGVLAPLGTGAALVLGGIAVKYARFFGAVLKAPYVAFLILCAAVVVTCLAVWGVAVLFRVVTGMPPGADGSLSARDILDALRGPCALPMTAYVLWPLQFEIVRDFLGMLGIVGFVNCVAAFGIWWERKVAGRMQSRLGPMRVGGWHGWAQSPADGIKLVLKEDLVPADGDAALFRLAPYIAFVPSICCFVALPFAAAYAFRDLDVALIFILAMLGIEVVGVIIAGWASNNKWSVYGAMREACQMVSYEIPMGMSLLIPVMMAGTLQLSQIAEAQGGGFHTWFIFANPWCFIAFFTYYTAALASCKRTPFDLPESESELVAGFLTEYSGFRWALFFFGEYAAMFAISGLAAILFFGGWKSPLPPAWAPDGTGPGALLVRGLVFDGPIIFIIKAMCLFFLQLWLRWTLPRIRIDQVLYACVQVLLPLTMVVLLGNTLWILGTKHYEAGWLIAIDAVLHWLLVALGLAVAAGLVGIAAYGFVNKRRLVGRLAIDHLPGS